MDIVFEPILLYIIAVILLRITGRRSLAQMTMSQTILVISLGNIIVEPFADTDVTNTIIIAVIFAGLLILFEYLEYHFKFFEKIMVGEKIIVVNKGAINEKNLNKLKLTEDELLSKLRQKGISNIKDIEKATLEANGELGYELTKAAKPLTVQDMEYILNKYLKNHKNSVNYIDLVDELEHKNS